MSVRRIANLHRFQPEEGYWTDKHEAQRRSALTPQAIGFLRKARAIVERGEPSPCAALSAAWDRRDPYGAIAVASVALDRALTTNQGVAAFDKAISALENG